MKIRYSFTADTKDIHIILRDKLSRYEMKHNVGEVFDSLNKALEKGGNLGYVKSEAYKLFEACQDLSKELSIVITVLWNQNNATTNPRNKDHRSRSSGRPLLVKK